MPVKDTMLCSSGSLLEDESTSSVISGVNFGVTLSDYSRLDDVSIYIVAPNGNNFSLMNQRCFGCSNSTIRLDFSLDSTTQVPISQCVSGLYAPSSADKLSSFLESGKAIGSWDLHVSVASPTSQVTVSEWSMSFATAGNRLAIGSSFSKYLAWTSDSSINASIPVGFGRTRFLSVATGSSELHKTRATFSYRDPLLTGSNSSMLDSNAICTSSTLVFLNGVHFSFQDASPRAAVRPSSCQQSNWLSDTAVACRESITSMTSILAITIDGLNSTVPFPLNRSKPVVLSSASNVNQTSVSTGATVMNIMGFGFAIHALSPNSVVGSTAVPASYWRSDSNVLVKQAHQFFRSSTSYRLSIESSTSATKVLTFVHAQSDAVTDALTSTGGCWIQLKSVSLQRFPIADMSVRVRLGHTACESSMWLSSSSLATKVPSSGSAFQSASLFVSAGSANSSLLDILTIKSFVQVSNITLVNSSALELLSVSGFGTSAPPAFYSSARVRFDDIQIRLCSPLNWLSDSSITCAYAAIPGAESASSVGKETLRNAVIIHVDFLKNCVDCILATISIANPGFVPSSKNLSSSISFWFYSPQVPLFSGSISKLSRDTYYSNQLIELSFVIVYNNSQFYVDPSTSSFADLMIDYHYTVATDRSVILDSDFESLPQIASVISSSKNAFGGHLQPRPQKFGIPAKLKQFTYNLTLGITLNSRNEYTTARLALYVTLPDQTWIPCESPAFFLQPLPESFIFLHNIIILTSNFTIGRLVANSSWAPVILYQVNIPEQFPLSCGELMFSYEAKLVCRLLDKDEVLKSSRFVAEKSCVFSPHFNNTSLPLSSFCYIGITDISLTDGIDIPHTAAMQFNFSTTFGPLATAMLIGSISQSLRGGSIIASTNQTLDSCLEVQLYDNFGNHYEQSGVLGTLSAFIDFEKSIEYPLIGNTTALSSDDGKLVWCTVMTSTLALNVSFHVSTAGFNVTISSHHNVNSSGEIAKVVLASPLPSNFSLTSGGHLPTLTVSLIDLGGNFVVFSPATFIRVRIFSRPPKLTRRRLLFGKDEVEETNSTCPSGGAAFVPVTSSVDVTINTTAFACTAGISFVVYDIVTFENGVMSVSGSVPLLSFEIFVLFGPALTFSLTNAKDTASVAFSNLVNVTLVTFKDAGFNVPTLHVP
jgi:hypothetical protein